MKKTEMRNLKSKLFEKSGNEKPKSTYYIEIRIEKTNLNVPYFSRYTT